MAQEDGEASIPEGADGGEDVTHGLDMERDCWGHNRVRETLLECKISEPFYLLANRPEPGVVEVGI